jgi:dTDP-4-dehydrorhamnose 3,5-epimerase
MTLNDAAQRVLSTQRYGGEPSIAGVELVDIRRFHDDGGSFSELGRLNHGIHAAFPGFEIRQVNYSEMDPGVIKAFHVHMRQTDVWFVPPSDKMLLVLVDVRAGSPTENARQRVVLGDGASRLVRVPPGVAHGVRNLASTRGHIIYFVDTHFSPEPGQCDEGRLPWDHVGAEIWEPVRG